MKFSSSGRVNKVLTLLLLFLGLANWLCAQNEEPHHILYLYHSQMGETDQENDGDEVYALPLAHLGMPLETLDVAINEPPTREEMARFRGIIAPAGSWISSRKWTSWMAREAREGQRRIFIVEPQAPADSKEEDREPLSDAILNGVYESLGLHLVSSLTATIGEDIVRIKNKEPGWFGYEAGLTEKECLWYMKVEKIIPQAKSILTLWWEDIPGSDAEAVIITPHGGFAIEEYLIKVDVKRDLRLWRIDPFRLFSEVFGAKGLPRLETNLINGGRTYFSHVDGDGFNSYSRTAEGRICGQVLHDEIYVNPAYGQLPVTLSIIGAEMDPGTTLCLAISNDVAKKLFELPNVEVASHAYAHPMDWRTRVLAWPGLLVNGEEYTYDARKETLGSLEIAQSLAAKGKKAKIILWSGNCNPDEEALRLVSSAGFMNMNGGDGRYDDKVPTITGLGPPSIKVGNEVRVQTGQANDYIFTDEWKDFAGFSKVIETAKRSGTPRLLMPINIYYHFYAGERQPSLDALRTIFNWVLEQKVTPVWTSDFARSVKAVRKAKISRTEDNGFVIKQDGSIPTIRFDETKAYPDLKRSVGVIGWCRLNGSLYLYLNGDETQKVWLSKEKPTEFALLFANRPVKGLKKDENKFSFNTWGPPKGKFQFQGVTPSQSFWARFESSNHTPLEVTFRSSAHGEASFELPLIGSGKIVVEEITDKQFAKVTMRQFWWAYGRFLCLVIGSALLAYLILRRSSRSRARED